MNPRVRLLIVVAFVVIIIGVVAVFALGGTGGGNNAAQQTGGAETTQEPGGGDGVVEQVATPTPIPVVEIVVSVQDIPRGLQIPPNAVVLRPWPEESAPSQGITNIEDVIGKRARTDIFREQPILSSMVVDDLTSLANVGSDLAAILPTNRVAVALPIDRITSVAYAIQPGDRVDIIISLLFVNVDTTFQSIEPNALNLLVDGGDGSFSIASGLPGRIDTIPAGRFGTLDVLVVPREEPRPRLVTQRTIQDALVMWSGDFPLDGRLFLAAATPTPVPPPDEEEAAPAEREDEVPPTPVPLRPDIITLAVSPQDAVVLTWFVEAKLPITFALRSATSASQVETEPVTLDYILNNFNISVPDRFSYSIEPAIRSIRQLYTGSQIQLSGVSDEQ